MCFAKSKSRLQYPVVHIEGLAELTKYTRTHDHAWGLQVTIIHNCRLTTRDSVSA